MAKVLLIPGSLHKNSLNKKLLEVCADFYRQKNVETHMIVQSDLDVPLINTDIALPPTLKTVADRIAGADAVVIGAPEYNAGISAVLKNVIDWTSTLRPHPWRGKAVLLVGTSPGDFGALTGLYHSRDPLDRLGARLWPQPYALPHGDKVISGTKITDATRQKNLETTLTDFMSYFASAK